MWIIYFLLVSFYGLAIRIASIFNPKAKLWVKGRSEQKQKIRSLRKNDEKRIWFHCASLGEFEQGRPVIEAVRKDYPNYKIVLTFFSPSGYEVKKDDPIADYVFYLPLDSPANAKSFIRSVNPTLVFFVKYEFWYFYGKELQKRKIPYFCISAIFRSKQIFFQPFIGEFFRKILLRFTHIFVQDQESLSLLYKLRVARVTVSGDTRFDRVYQNSLSGIDLPLIKSFVENKKTIVFGSTWAKDESVFVNFINDKKNDFKFIIAQHEISKEGILNLRKQIVKSTVTYSDLSPANNFNADVLIIDSIGILSRIYAYANYAYIGGGFGAGIHNILEAAVYGLPIFIGPNFSKFKEAVDLVKSNSAFVINQTSDLQLAITRIEADLEEYKRIAATNKKYVESRKGSTEVVIGYLELNNPA
jgi:3-deoxy-D-manno-octulosonic-acid transferase